MFPRKSKWKKVKNINFTPISGYFISDWHEINININSLILFSCKKFVQLPYIISSLVSRNVFLLSKKLYLMWIIHIPLCLLFICTPDCQYIGLFRKKSKQAGLRIYFFENTPWKFSFFYCTPGNSRQNKAQPLDIP